MPSMCLASILAIDSGPRFSYDWRPMPSWLARVDIGAKSARSRNDNARWHLAMFQPGGMYIQELLRHEKSPRLLSAVGGSVSGADSAPAPSGSHHCGTSS